MTQTLSRGLVGVLLCALALGASPAALAQDGPSIRWEPHKDAAGVTVPGLEIVKLHELFDPHPGYEHVLLRLTDERKREMMEDPGAFLYRHRVFTKPLRSGMSCSSYERPDAPSDTSTLKWVADVGHWPDSYGRCCTFLVSFPSE